MKPKPKVGEWWKLRNGKKALILSLDFDQHQPVTGDITPDYGHGSWGINGDFSVPTYTDVKMDLIERCDAPAAFRRGVRKLNT